MPGARCDIGSNDHASPFFDQPDRVRPYFAKLRELSRRAADRNREGNVRLTELSMGMSGDFEAAVEEGATLVRVGTLLFRLQNLTWISSTNHDEQTRA